MAGALRDFCVLQGISIRDIADIAVTTVEYIDRYEACELQMPIYQFYPLIAHFGFSYELSVMNFGTNK